MQGKTVNEIIEEFHSFDCEEQNVLYSNALSLAITWDLESRFEAFRMALGYEHWRYEDGKIYYSKKPFNEQP